MINCIKDLYDYDLVKKCCRCKLICLKSNFYKNINMIDGLHPQCISCSKKYYNENRDREKQYFLDNRDRIKEYQLKNRDQINTRMNDYIKNRIKTDVNFRLIRNARRRIHHGFNGRSKSSSTKDILGMDIDLYRNWIEFQMTPEMKMSNIEIDHVKAICMFDVSDDEQLKEAFSWKNTQPLLKQDHRLKGIKFNFLEYENQFIKAYQFIKLNDQERLN